ncbi:hypothetical protein [Stieleria sp.]|uniref:hypothetical protein n=1 Tax=Stieleria sp. TaxID=2795976 RepID=UPI00356241FB
MRSTISKALAVLVIVHGVMPSNGVAENFFGRLKRLAGETEYHGTPPVTGQDGVIERLAENIDWLEHYLDRYGSVVAKQPDIWGEARLTKHRDEYERIMFSQLGGFERTINASISQSDAAFLSQAIALSNAASGAAVTPAVADQAPTAVASAQLIEADALTTDFKSFGIDSDPPNRGISLEPVVVLDQMSRYLKHLHELRRVNEGDDTSDSPGYSLNLVRIPVSILPGKLTRQGFGAEVTVTARPVISDDLMPTTFRNLAVNDVVDFLGLPLVRVTERLDKVVKAYHYKVSHDQFRETIAKIDSISRPNQTGDDFVKDASPIIEEFLQNELAVKAIVEAFKDLGETLSPGTSTTDQASSLVASEMSRAMKGLSLYSMQQQATAFAPATVTYPVAVQETVIDPMGKKVTITAYEQKEEKVDPTEEAKKLVDAIKQKNANLVASQLFRIGLIPSDPSPSEVLNAKASGALQTLAAGAKGVATVAPSGRTRRALNPLNPTALEPVIGIENLVVISEFFNESYYGRYIRWSGGPNSEQCKENRVDLLDAQRFLRSELDAAYELLSRPGHLDLFAYLASPHSKLADQIRAGHFTDEESIGTSVETLRKYFFQQLHKHEAISVPQCDQEGQLVISIDSLSPTQASSVVQALAWAIVVEAALLNDRLNLDVQKLARATETYDLGIDRDYWFFLPDSVVKHNDVQTYLQDQFASASEVFKRYVEVRWPIHVFAVDPVNQEQNVADVSRRQRELQFALALGFATGKIGINSLTQYSRKLQTQVETIGLNRTVVGFGHGRDTFGWRFYPRVQSLPVPGTLGSIRETLLGTSRDYDLKHRQVEPGQRECVAVVLMPSFVPYADFDIRTNWFKLTNPKNSALTMKDTVKLSRSITAMRNSRAQCAQCQHLYREGELRRLFARVDQLDRELPLQTQRALVPYENTLGGFEMFNTGVTDLSPELIGWYGAPGINIDDDFDCGCYQGCGLKKDGSTPQSLSNSSPIPTCQGKGTTLFLVGDNFSVHDTKVIAGGVCIPDVRLISRDLMRVTIPPCVNVMELCEEGGVKNYVAVYVATPYGITNHLHVPVHAPTKSKVDDQIEDAVKSAVAKLNLPPAVATVSAGNVQVSAIGDPETVKLQAVSSVDVSFTPATDPRFKGREVTIYAAVKSGDVYIGSQSLTELQTIVVGENCTFKALGDGDRLLRALEQMNPSLIPADGKALKLKIVYFAAFNPKQIPTQLSKETDMEIKRFPAAAAGGDAGPAAAEGLPAPLPDASFRKQDADCNCQTASTAMGQSGRQADDRLRVLPAQQRTLVESSPIAAPLERSDFGDLLDRLERIEEQQRGNAESVSSLLQEARAKVDEKRQLGRPVSTVEVSVNVPRLSDRLEENQNSSPAIVRHFKTSAGEQWRNLRDQLSGN